MNQSGQNRDNKSTAWLSLGTNLGDREENLDKALQLVDLQCGNIIARSRVFTSPPWGYFSANPYYNMCVKIGTGLEPSLLLKRLLQAEDAMGRKRTPGKYTDRIIDLDILFFDDLTMETPELTIPHPRAHRRLFVLRPLAEIAPDLPHPVFRIPISQLLAELEKSDPTPVLPVE